MPIATTAAAESIATPTVSSADSGRDDFCDWAFDGSSRYGPTDIGVDSLASWRASVGVRGGGGNGIWLGGVPKVGDAGGDPNVGALDADAAVKGALISAAMASLFGIVLGNALEDAFAVAFTACIDAVDDDVALEGDTAWSAAGATLSSPASAASDSGFASRGGGTDFFASGIRDGGGSLGRTILIDTRRRAVPVAR